MTICLENAQEVSYGAGGAKIDYTKIVEVELFDNLFSINFG